MEIFKNCQTLVNWHCQMFGIELLFVFFFQRINEIDVFALDIQLMVRLDTTETRKHFSNCASCLEYYCFDSFIPSPYPSWTDIILPKISRFSFLSFDAMLSNVSRDADCSWPSSLLVLRRTLFALDFGRRDDANRSAEPLLPKKNLARAFGAGNGTGNDNVAAVLPPSRLHFYCSVYLHSHHGK